MKPQWNLTLALAIVFLLGVHAAFKPAGPATVKVEVEASDASSASGSSVATRNMLGATTTNTALMTPAATSPADALMGRALLQRRDRATILQPRGGAGRGDRPRRPERGSGGARGRDRDEGSRPTRPGPSRPFRRRDRNRDEDRFRRGVQLPRFDERRRGRRRDRDIDIISPTIIVEDTCDCLNDFFNELTIDGSVTCPCCLCWRPSDGVERCPCPEF